MSFLCDTTVLFAASDAGHRHHEPSLALVAGATPGDAFVAAHSLAELYATLTAVQVPRVRRPSLVLEAVEHVASAFSPIALSVDDYVWVVRHVADRGERSGVIYDALILKCAERAGVNVVYTWNLAHFSRVAWPEIAPRIRTP